MMLDDGSIDFSYKIDPKLKSDTEIDIGERKYTYDEIKEMFPVQKQNPINCLIYWDDLMQLTSLGLMEILNSIYKLNAKVDIDHFLSRNNEYVYGMKYVFKVYEGVLTREQIVEVRNKYYWKILEISPTTGLYESINKIDSYFSRLGFYFPVKFQNQENLLQGYKDIFFKNRPMNGNMKFYFASDGKNINGVMKGGSYNTIITPNILDTYNYIIENNLKRITMLGPDNHNGITDEFYDLMYKYRKFPKPNYCEINLFNELVMRPRDR